jgi:hypothetical protein
MSLSQGKVIYFLALPPSLNNNYHKITFKVAEQALR